MFPEGPICPLPTSSGLIRELMIQFSGRGRKEMSPLAASHISGKAPSYTLPFSCRRNHGQRRISFIPKLCHLWGGVMWKKSNLLHTPVHPNQLVCSSSVLELLWKPGPPRRLSFIGDSRSLCSRDSWTMAERGWSQHMGHCRVPSRDRGLYACYLL